MEMWGYILRTAVALLLVVPLIYLAARIYARQGGQGRQGTWVSILEVVPVNQKNQILVVRIGDRVMVLGVGEHGFQVISTIEGEVPAGILGKETEVKEELWLGLKNFARQWLGKASAVSVATQTPNPDEEAPAQQPDIDEVPGETEIKDKIERIRKIKLEQGGESHAKR